MRRLVMLIALAGCDEVGTAEDTALAIFRDVNSARCESNGALDFTSVGVGLDAYEGATVWVSVVEPDPDINGSPQSIEDAPVRVFFEETIEDGGFYTFCAQGLDENLAYPSHVVIIDADGDGVCSEGDVAELYQMYGWVDAVSVTTTTKRLRPVTSEPNVWGHSMCAYYIR